MILHLDYLCYKLNKNFFLTYYNDAPRSWGVFFQDSASPQMESLIELHNAIMFFLFIILFGVAWMLIVVVINFTKIYSPFSSKFLNHGIVIEFIWTICPALTIVFIIIPSFKLLYLSDEVTDPLLTLCAEGHQWYWSYGYPEFNNEEDDNIEYDSYLVPDSDLEKGKLRMLEVDNRILLPELTHTRLIVSSADVIHSFACPSLAVKCDAYPGRLNQTSVFANRRGTFFGQCSEICGILHSSMPIVFQTVHIEDFVFWLKNT